MSTSPFPLRGAMEGFYGTFYTFPERNDLIRFLGKHGLNFYLYGPKNDRQHRQRWWDPYPKRIMTEFGHTIQVAQKSGVEFCYAISFGVPLNCGSDLDFAIVIDKLGHFYDLGCRSFAILLDDLSLDLNHQEPGSSFASAAEAHAYFCNRVHTWLSSRDEPAPLALCPAEYSGRAPFPPYLHDLGKALHPDINLFYTGPAVCSPTITVGDLESFAAATGRAPIVWDNYPVNDLIMRPELHLGPLRGRDPHLAEACKGYVANLMVQPEASKIPLITTAEYLMHPLNYEPDAAWERALREIGGKSSYKALHLLAENALASCLEKEEAPHLTRLTTHALAELMCGTSVSTSPGLVALSLYLNDLDEAVYYLKNRMANLALRQNLLPWIEALDDKLWMARFAINILRDLESGSPVASASEQMEARLTDVERSSKKIGGTSLLSLVAYAQERLEARGVPEEAARKLSAHPSDAAQAAGG